MNNFKKNTEEKVTSEVNFAQEGTLSGKEVERAQTDYEKKLEALRKMGVNFEGTNFAALKDGQSENRKQYRVLNEALYDFYENMGLKIQGFSKFNTEEQKIMDDADKALTDAKALVTSTAAELKTANAVVKTIWNSNWFNKSRQNAIDTAQANYDAAVAAQAFAENDIEPSRIRAKEALEARKGTMSAKEWQQEFMSIANQLLAANKKEKDSTTKQLGSIEKSVTDIKQKLADTSDKKTSLETEKKTLDAKVITLTNELADITDHRSKQYTDKETELNAAKTDQVKNAGELNTAIATQATYKTQLETSGSQHRNMIDQYNTIDLLIKQLEAQIPYHMNLIETYVRSAKNADLIEVSSNQNATNNFLDQKSMEGIIQAGIQSIKTVKKTFVEVNEHGIKMTDMITQGDTVSRDLLTDLDEYKKENFGEKGDNGKGGAAFDPNKRSTE